MARGESAAWDQSRNHGVVRRSSAHVEGTDAGYAAERLSVLTHELANLLDASMRTLSLACRAVNGPAAPREEAVRRLTTVQESLRQMSALVRGAMGSSREALCARLGFDAWSLSEAIQSAADVMTPVAEGADVALTCRVDPLLSSLPAGAMYTVIAAAVRNGIESIEGTRRGAGRIDITASVESGKGVTIDITDDGGGPPPLGDVDPGVVFTPGFTTKAGRGGAGIGLAVARDVVTELGGRIELLGREPEEGAILRIWLPRS